MKGKPQECGFFFARSENAHTSGDRPWYAGSPSGRRGAGSESPPTSGMPALRVGRCFAERIKLKEERMNQIADSSSLLVLAYQDSNFDRQNQNL